MKTLFTHVGTVSVFFNIIDPRSVPFLHQTKPTVYHLLPNENADGFWF